MSEIVEKINEDKPQREGTRIVGVSPNGEKIYSYGGKELADDEGIAVTNSRWGERFQFNGTTVLALED